ncbi:MAG: signal peptidase [Fibrobacterota bacterium]|jgi:signal peptidase II
MKRFVQIFSPVKTHIALLLGGIAVDQATKFWAVHSLGDLKAIDGFMYSRNPMEIVGQWFQFNLAYNKGAAFSVAPQQLLPFLHPTLFFTLVTLVAFGGLAILYKRRPFPHFSTRLGVALVISGGIGNLLDRWRLGRVVDFISVGVPDMTWRWPTFNIADSLICVGVGLLVLADNLDVSLFKTRESAGEVPVEITEAGR